MRFRRLLLACGLCAAAAVSAEEPAAPAAPDFSVLTPSMDGRFLVNSNFSALSLVPYAGGLAHVDAGARSRRLRRLVAADRYDPVTEISSRLIDALDEAGFRAVLEPIARKPAGSVQSLSWSDLPEHPRGKLFLDANIRWICLCSGDTYFKYRPAISIGWRLLDPGQEVVQPTRTLTYVHAPGWQVYDTTSTRTVSSYVPPPPYPPATVSESCGFNGIDEIEESPQRFWACLAETYDVAVRRLVIDLIRVHPPRAAATASSGTPSGISTR